MTESTPAIESRSRASLLRNTVANYSGRILSAVVNVAFVPVYLRLLGTEAYGLIGLFITVQGVMQLFDLGLSATMNRELARLSSNGERNSERSDLVRTFEVAYWIIGLALALAVASLSPFMVSHWLQGTALAPTTLSTALVLMGIVAGVNWPVGLYSGGLLGLERHVALNGLNGLFSLVRYGGAALILLVVRRDIVAYFEWQIVASLVQVICLRFLLWREIGCGATRPQIRASIVAARKNLICGISGTYAALIVLTQIDKVIVSQLVPLSEFGYYSIAWTAAGVFYLFYSPLSATFYPRITALCGQSRGDLAVQAYEFGSLLTAILVFPTGAILCIFSREVVGLWISDPSVVEHTHLLVRWLAPSAALTSLLSMSNMLQWAQGATRIGFWTNTIGAVSMAPLVAMATRRHGALGAALACSLLRIAQALVQTHLVHTQFLPDRVRSWYRDLTTIVLISSGIVALGKLMMQPTLTGSNLVALLAFLWVVATFASALACAMTGSSAVAIWRARAAEEANPA